MTWETALRSRLLDDSAVAAIVGTEIAFALAPQKWLPPFIVITVITDDRPVDLDGFVATRASTVQFDCYAPSYSVAAEMREAVIAAIHPAGTYNTVAFAGAFIDGVRASIENTSTSPIHRISIDAQVWHS